MLTSKSYSNCDILTTPNLCPPLNKVNIDGNRVDFTNMLFSINIFVNHKNVPVKTQQLKAKVYIRA